MAKNKTTKKTAAKTKSSKKKTAVKKAKKKVSKKKLFKKATIKKVAKKKQAKKAKAKVVKKEKVKSTKKKTTKKATKKKAKKTTAKSRKKLGQKQLPLEMEEWPKDKDLLWNPKRHKYLTGPRPEACVFCAAANYGVDFKSLCLFKSSHAQVVLNKYPYHTGHIMVMPVRHVADLDSLDGQEFFQIMSLLRRSAHIIKKVYKCEGLNIGINLGAAAGAGIPGHLHWHIIPRWTGDTNFFPALAGTRIISESLEDTYKKLLPYFKEETRQLSLPGANDFKQVEFKLED